MAKKTVPPTTRATAQAPIPPRAAKATAPAFLSQPWFPPLLLFVLAFILYANTLRHGYALDDAIVITQNSYTQEGFAGLPKIFGSDAFEAFFSAKKDLVAGGRYRPLSIATFAIEFELFGLNPGISHFINVLLYSLLGILTFYTLRLIFLTPQERPWYTGLPFWVALLFVTHPIHTEVVANIKGRDELLAMLFSLGAVWAALKYARTHNLLFLALIFVSIFLGALSKETAVPFLLIIPIALWCARSRNLKTYGITTAAVLLGIATYLILRFKYAGGFGSGLEGEILNDPFLGSSYMQQLATASKTFVLYLGKLFIPATLSHDYYFNQVPVVGWSDPLAILGLLLTLALLYIGIKETLKGNPIGFGILFFFLTFSIVSNVLLPIGTTMGERFMFVPSLGFLIVVIAALQSLIQRFQPEPSKLILPILGIVALAFSARTIARNPVWENDFVLFTTDVANSPNSAKMRTAAGGALVDAALKPENAAKKLEYLNQAIPHLQRAVEIYPDHGTAWLILGNAYFNLGNHTQALQTYRQAIAVRPGMADAYKNAGIAAQRTKDHPASEAFFTNYLSKKPDDIQAWEFKADNYEAWGKPQEAIATYQEVIRRDPKRDAAIGKLGMVYGKFFQNYAQAIPYLEQALALNPKEEMHYENTGIAYAMKGEPQKALDIFNRGLQQFPNSPKLLRNIGITYINLGDTATAQQYFQRAEGK